MSSSTSWNKSIVQTDYTVQGLVARMVLDLFLTNLGLLLGILTTVWIWTFTWAETSRDFFYQMYFQVWLANVPLLTACCLLAYVLCGLYQGNQHERYLDRIALVVRSVGTAFILFFLFMYIKDAFMPRSTFVAGWFFIFLFILSSRLLSMAFYRRYHLVPADMYNPRIDEIIHELAILAQQDGWVPPEGLPRKGAWPHFEEDEISAATRVLRSGKINQWTGNEVALFQREFADACGVRHGIALANGTVALELALRACGIGPGDEVIVTPRTFVASASSVALAGATPVFADVDQDSQNVTAETIRPVLSPRTRAIVAVHLAGWPCAMDGIMALANDHGLKVIEDCAQAHGALYRGRAVGSLGHAAVFSFCQDKIMSTGGEGGMLITDDDSIWETAWAYKDHGKSYDAVYRREHGSGFRWLHESFGTNWRMTEIQAAIGRRQLLKLPEWVELRRRHADILSNRFRSMPALRVVTPGADYFHSYYKYYLFVRPERLRVGWDRDRLLREIMQMGVPCFSGSCSEVYLEKAFVDSGIGPSERLPVARELGETSLMFLVHPTLRTEDLVAVADAVAEVMKKASS